MRIPDIMAQPDGRHRPPGCVTSVHLPNVGNKHRHLPTSGHIPGRFESMMEAEEEMTETKNSP